MKLNELKPRPGSTFKKKRVGCGPGSGHGKTSTRGHKGHKQRSGYRVKMGFEGGQNPLTRRIPKRGFFNISKKVYEIVNIFQLGGFEANSEITPDVLKQKGMIKGRQKLKILSQGDITKPLVVKAHSFSKKAADKIKSAGGRTEIIA